MPSINSLSNIIQNSKKLVILSYLILLLFKIIEPSDNEDKI